MHKGDSWEVANQLGGRIEVVTGDGTNVAQSNGRPLNDMGF
jgi:hypothetical protein